VHWVLLVQNAKAETCPSSFLKAMYCTLRPPLAPQLHALSFPRNCERAIFDLIQSTSLMTWDRDFVSTSKEKVPKRTYNLSPAHFLLARPHMPVVRVRHLDDRGTIARPLPLLSSKGMRYPRIHDGNLAQSWMKETHLAFNQS
jgi:hypothetical protein